MPWRNGGGITHEVAVSPEGAGLDGFDWRLSLALVAQGGPFSRFEGVDRTLAVIEGGGLYLLTTGRPEILLDPWADPLPFTGEEAVTSRLPAGPTLDFNVMTRRAGWSHAVRRIDVEGRSSLTIRAPVVAILCQEGDLRLPGLDMRLRARDCLLVTGPERALDLEGRGRALLAEIAPRDA
ncbi:HutD/Ves family protein [Rubellimicrobium arenae]|uniref:HutD/Ves family protein n=1 Tax=Rubellimicrobium arenae TaxID=2817372 RepID=UPI001B304C6E|nr:HutD family protein [Rubellimicrobium arenae]